MFGGLTSPFTLTPKRRAWDSNPQVLSDNGFKL
jgi:hypothetical protein